MNWIPVVLLLVLLAFIFAVTRAVRERPSITCRVVRDLQGHSVVHLPGNWAYKRVVVIQLDDEEDV